MHVSNIIADQKQSADRTSSVKHTLLFVDDEVRVLKALKRVFVDDDYKILTAENGKAALEILADNSVNLVVSDYSMPGMTGIDLLKIIREKYPDTIRIMLTAHSNTDIVMGAVNDGAVYKFINKPWNDDDLSLSIELALAQFDLIRENKKLKRVAQKQLTEINRLKHFTGIDYSPLSSILIDKGVLLPGQLEIVEKYRKQNNTILIRSLIDLGMVEEESLLKVIQVLSKTDFISFPEFRLDEDFSKLLPRDVCEIGCLAPVRKENKTITAVRL
ncbi:MAG: response regulator [candidate division Zixibacteria bacterium]|nr:response regulator [candidate division Zixibacteria bacterium]